MLPRLVATLAAVILVLAGCGGGGSEQAVGTAPAATTVEVTVETQPVETQPVETQPVETQAAATDPAAAESAAQVTALVEAWYAQADPKVCGHMTPAFVKLFWRASGPKGVKACQTAITSAQPVEDVVVEDVFVDDETARLRVVYTLDGARRSDGVAFVKEDGNWLIDQITDTRDEEASA